MANSISKWLEVIQGQLYESKCPKCGNIDRLTERETKKTVHCQRCYFHYDYKEDE